MNTSSQSCFCKGAIFDTKHTTPSVARVLKAARLFRFVAMCGSLKVRSLAAQQSSPLFGFCFLTGDRAKPSLPNLFPRFWCSSVVPVKTSVSIRHVFLLGQTFKIFNAIIRLVSVNVMHVLFRVKRLQPASRHNTMSKSFSAQHGISIGSQSGRVRLELSENFSAMRNSKQMVKKSIFDTVYLGANHVVPLGS